jgi:hypothetical protein
VLERGRSPRCWGFRSTAQWSTILSTDHWLCYCPLPETNNTLHLSYFIHVIQFILLLFYRHSSKAFILPESILTQTRRAQSIGIKIIQRRDNGWMPIKTRPQ